MYAGLADCIDPVVEVVESDLESADRIIAALLRNKGIDPAMVTGAEGLALLRDLAVMEATATAARRAAADGGDTVMWAKVRAYTAEAVRLSQRIGSESLGLVATGTAAAAFASIPLERV